MYNLFTRWQHSTCVACIEHSNVCLVLAFLVYTLVFGVVQDLPSLILISGSLFFYLFITMLFLACHKQHKTTHTSDNVTA